MAQTMEHGHPLEDLLGQGGEGGWNPIRYDRFHGDPKTRPFAYGIESVNLAWRYAADPLFLKGTVAQLIPPHWWDVVFDLLRESVVKLDINRNAPWTFLTWLNWGFGSQHVLGTMPRFDRSLGLRFGRELASGILKAALPARGIVEPDEVVAEVGRVVTDGLEVGTHLAFHGQIEEGARTMARGLARMSVAAISALALAALTESVRAASNRVSRSALVSEWMLRFPQPKGLQPVFMEQVRRSRGGIVVSRASDYAGPRPTPSARPAASTSPSTDEEDSDEKKTPVRPPSREERSPWFFELTSAGFAACPSDGLANPMASGDYVQELQRMNQALRYAQRQSPTTEPPFLFTTGVAGMNDPIMVALDGNLFVLGFPDLADLMLANTYFTKVFHWPPARF